VKVNRIRKVTRGFLWIIPALAATAVIKLNPLGLAAYWSLSRGTFDSQPESIDTINYQALLEDPLLASALKNNLILLVGVPLAIAVALGLSAALFTKVRGAKLLESIYFVPFIPAVASVSVVFIYFLGDSGPVNTLLRSLRGEEAAISWLTSPGLASWSVMMVMTWKRVGLFVLLFMARLVNLDRDLFDAAAVDGASWPVAFRHVAMPQMRGVIGFAALIGVIEVFSYGFGYIFVLTQGGPQNSTFTLEFLLYRVLFQRFHVGTASAIAVVILVLVALLAIPLIRWQRRDPASASN
jgi:multiple sugar transport system permease protein